MTDRVHQNPRLIFSVGTQVVTLREIVSDEGRILHPKGAVGVVVRSPSDLQHSYRVRFLDGVEEALPPADVLMLAHFKEGEIGDVQAAAGDTDLYERVIYRCVVGSRAYGLASEQSDTDYRGILPPAELQWSLYGVPDQIERDDTQEHYWELQRFLVFALKANPNVLECLYTPLVERATPLAQELLAMRSAFLSRLVYQTFNGYVTSQFKKMQADIRNQCQLKWKHVMHLIRLLISGIGVLRDGVVPVEVGEHREQLLAVKRGELPWEETERWRLSLHREFDQALNATKLPERPDYERANAFLIKARRAALGDIAMNIDPRLHRQVEAHPYPLLFVTISGAHLYGFPSPDSDYDLRGAHLLPLCEVVGLRSGDETIEKSGVHDGLEIDLVTHDAKKFLGLMLKKNGYVLEQLLSPLVVHTTPEHAELKSLAAGCITRHHAHHYLGFAATQWKLFHKESPPRVKPLLYVYRVLLTGIHLMRSGEVEANLVHLNEAARLAYIPDLIARKLCGPEKGTLAAADLEFHEREYQRLTAELEQAYQQSRLPETAQATAALNDLLVRIRLRGAS